MPFNYAFTFPIAAGEPDVFAAFVALAVFSLVDTKANPPTTKEFHSKSVKLFKKASD